jgi:hypothetical protein
MNSPYVFRETKEFENYQVAAEYVKNLNGNNQKIYDGTRITCIFGKNAVKCSMNHNNENINYPRLCKRVKWTEGRLASLLISDRSKDSDMHFKIGDVEIYINRISCTKGSEKTLKEFKQILHENGLIFNSEKIRAHYGEKFSSTAS